MATRKVAKRRLGKKPGVRQKASKLKVGRKPTLLPRQLHSTDSIVSANDDSIRINIPGVSLLALSDVDRSHFQREAMRWGYTLRNRARWNNDSAATARHQKEMRELADRLGFTRDVLLRLAKEPLVEVDVLWRGEEVGWEHRIFPWEFMLASVTRDMRGGKPITIVRRLRTPPERGSENRASAAPSSWLQVLSAPGLLAENYDFTGEQRILKLCVESLKGTLAIAENPSQESLLSEVTKRSPDVLHLSGFDSHQGTSLIGLRDDRTVQDGYLVRGLERKPHVIPAEALSDILTAGRERKPQLISCNIYNSGARLAPLCVAKGAHAAIGFQDSFDDSLAELFFHTLYRSWQLADWSLTAAFAFAWKTLRDQNQPLRGSGIVFWSKASILDQAPHAEQALTKPTRKKARSRSLAPIYEAPTADQIHDQLEVDVALISQLNYSILHNNGPIFERFRVRKKRLSVGRVDDLQVRVELYVGTDSYPFRMKASLSETDTYVDFPHNIRVSLASSLSRAIRESIHTSLFVEVLWHDAVLYRQTHRVTLLPIDEWRFDTDNYRWLPSFVLPRDPAVLRVIDSAQRYLMALRDDATAGFDGYQCVDGRHPPKPADCSLVDMQVRAIWSSLLYECPLSYINPPPVFTDSSQRLRTPSDCVDGKRGTCIDLALLLAACLEYVEIYPTIFLLKTHAFPAYWRHDSYHEDFRAARDAAVDEESDIVNNRQAGSVGQKHGWDFQVSEYREILAEVQAGHLVPLETTLVTGRGSFAEAIDSGIKNLASRREFESMLDILLARTDLQTSVTPLPIRRSDI